MEGPYPYGISVIDIGRSLYSPHLRDSMFENEIPRRLSPSSRKTPNGGFGGNHHPSRRPTPAQLWDKLVNLTKGVENTKSMNNRRRRAAAAAAANRGEGEEEGGKRYENREREELKKKIELRKQQELQELIRRKQAMQQQSNVSQSGGHGVSLPLTVFPTSLSPINANQSLQSVPSQVTATNSNLERANSINFFEKYLQQIKDNNGGDSDESKKSPKRSKSSLAGVVHHGRAPSVESWEAGTPASPFAFNFATTSGSSPVRRKPSPIKHNHSPKPNVQLSVEVQVPPHFNQMQSQIGQLAQVEKEVRRIASLPPNVKRMKKKKKQAQQIMEGESSEGDVSFEAMGSELDEQSQQQQQQQQQEQQQNEASEQSNSSISLPSLLLGNSSFSSKNLLKMKKNGSGSAGSSLGGTGSAGGANSGSYLNPWLG